MGNIVSLFCVTQKSNLKVTTQNISVHPNSCHIIEKLKQIETREINKEFHLIHNLGDTNSINHNKQNDIISCYLLSS